MLVQVGRDQDAVVDVVDHAVALDERVVAAAEHDAVAERAPFQRHARGAAIVVAFDVVANDVHLAERRQQLGVEGVGHDAGPVEPPRRADDLEISAGVGARVAEGVALGHDPIDDRVAGMALADVEAGVGRARSIGVLEQAVDRVEGVDAVILVGVGGHIRGAVAAYPGPEQPVDACVAHGQVLDRDRVGGDADPVGPLELGVDDHPVAVAAPDDQGRHRDLDLLAVDARPDQDQVARPGGVDGRLDGPVVIRHPAGGAAWTLHRRDRLAGAALARVVGDVADDQGRGHPLPAVLGRVEAAEEAVHPGRVEDDGRRLVVVDAVARPPAAVDGDGVVGRPTLVGEPDPAADRHSGDLAGEEVVVHRHVDRAGPLLPVRAAGEDRAGQQHRQHQAGAPAAGHGVSSDGGVGAGIFPPRHASPPATAG